MNQWMDACVLIIRVWTSVSVCCVRIAFARLVGCVCIYVSQYVCMYACMNGCQSACMLFWFLSLCVSFLLYPYMRISFDAYMSVFSKLHVYEGRIVYLTVHF